MKYIKIYLLLFTVFLQNILWAQVTIGSGEKATDGALLDLKEVPSTNQTTSTKGLLLPRVIIPDLKILQMGDNKIENTNDAWLKHSGLMVYNVKRDDCANVMPGVHLWGGSEWLPLGEASKFIGETEVLTDVRGSEVVNYQIGRFKSANTDAGWWMLENVRATKWADGTSTDIEFTIPSETNLGNGDEPLYTYPMADPAKVSEHGFFYNYAAASRKGPVYVEQFPDKVQGICPDGWHLPSQDDWRILFRAITENPCQFSRSSVGANYAGNAQKMDVTPLGKSRPMKEGGFNAVLTGVVFPNGNIGDVDSYGYYWNRYPSISGGNQILGALTFVFYTATQHGIKLMDTSYYLPVRCVKDAQ
ncbi:FISUMP domain-containing protein [Dysgonomonas sp. ZJ709]|uniref:FISUMP domain-containing protein n=1 Tax=Dysgonomonas sp. ZJ709 TaxID=2709797 RepID=UPI0013EB2852|nr:FISUMP domain-containing protein [Dysgonomonas sp. ZJ709]